MSVQDRLVVILGPTATGKSSLAISLAEKLHGEILACDSTQVYRRFDIGTAKISPGERRGIPHHLLDVVEPTEIFTAGDYQRRASEVLADLRRRKKLAIVTAGTGLYLKALLEGLSDAPTRSEELRRRLRDKAAQRGPSSLHKLLHRLDPDASRRIAERDTQKVIRALEMRLLAGKPVGEIHRRGRKSLEGYEVKKIGLLPPRPALYARIDARVRAMVEAGWIEEVQALIASGVPEGAKPFQFIGYSQLHEHLAGRLSKEDAIHQIQQATRQFAKRQITWFRKETEVHWLAGFGDDPEIAAASLEFLRR
ncbi:MAG TPA: tRNA (adenosine(37)-N6)-dimethylallyltransferase MiaA [Candidatus Limnocylindrales bacterium]|nr:tRNA (adenosine(37)-N6)-dimethylallyltransferase MiaA [Candidatus Limnocylindrales bacterium]